MDWVESDSHWVAWAAGLFEGEGCITMCVPYVVRMQVNMTDEDVVRKFQKVVKCGNIYGPYDRGKGNKPHTVWVLEGRPTVISLCDLFYPYLGKRRRAKIDEVYASPGFQKVLARI